MTPAATPEALRTALIHACFDPGHVIGPRDGRTMDEWRGDACMKQIAPLLAALSTATAEAASLRAEVEAKDRRIAKLEAALEPFARFGDAATPDTAVTWAGLLHTLRISTHFRHEQFRAARTALARAATAGEG
jgi:hypothetical protein